MINYHKLTEEDHLFIKKTEDCVRAVTKYKTPQFSKFISPHERAVFEQFADVSPFVTFKVWGGSSECERNIVGFFPDFIEPEEALFPVSALLIKSVTELGHRDVLGSVLGLGIERSLLGDIFPREDGAVLFCLDTIADFISMNLKKVGNNSVKVSVTDASEVSIAPKKTKQISGTVASTRLDSIVGLATGKARAKSQDIIRAGLVQLNWCPEENPSTEVSEGDMLSVRGYGRMKIVTASGETKKGRIRVVIEQYI